MSRHDDPMDHDCQMEAEAGSSNRPPQFNESNCGYRCGWGCCEPQGGEDEGGGGSESNATPTLIGSEDDMENVYQPMSHADESHFTSPRDAWTHEEEAVVLVHPFEEDLQLHRYLHAQGDVYTSAMMHLNHDELDSLQNQATTRSQSSAASDVGSVGSMSRDVLVAGAGTWNEDIGAEHFPGYFRKTPLRLSPQYEHCRGPSLSHLVTQDLSTLRHSMENIWGVGGQLTDYALIRHAGFPAR